MADLAECTSFPGWQVRFSLPGKGGIPGQPSFHLADLRPLQTSATSKQNSRARKSSWTSPVSDLCGSVD